MALQRAPYTAWSRAIWIERLPAGIRYLRRRHCKHPQTAGFVASAREQGALYWIGTPSRTIAMKHQFAYATSAKHGVRWLAKRDRKALLKIRDVPLIGQHPCAVDDDHLKLVPVAREADTVGQISGDEVPNRRKRNPGMLAIPIGLEIGLNDRR